MYLATLSLLNAENTCIDPNLVQSYGSVPFGSLFMAVMITFSVQRMDPNFLSEEIIEKLKFLYATPIMGNKF